MVQLHIECLPGVGTLLLYCLLRECHRMPSWCGEDPFHLRCHHHCHRMPPGVVALLTLIVVCHLLAPRIRGATHRPYADPGV